MIPPDGECMSMEVSSHGEYQRAREFNEEG